MLLMGPALGWSDVPRPDKPNIVLILVDDLGWQDVKCYDIDEPTPMETPNLDALASKGVKFWQGYSPAPTCAPSRAAILSGHHVEGVLLLESIDVWITPGSAHDALH